MKKYCRKCRWFYSHWGYSYKTYCTKTYCTVKGRWQKEKITGKLYREEKDLDYEKENKNNDCLYYKRNWFIL